MWKRTVKSFRNKGLRCLSVRQYLPRLKRNVKSLHTNIGTYVFKWWSICFYLPQYRQPTICSRFVFKYTQASCGKRELYENSCFFCDVTAVLKRISSTGPRHYATTEIGIVCTSSMYSYFQQGVAWQTLELIVP